MSVKSTIYPDSKLFLYDDSIALYDYQGHNGLRVLGEETYRKISAGSGLAGVWGQDQEFVISKQGEQFLSQVYLEIKVTGVTNSDGSATYNRFSDAAPLHMIDRIYLSQNGKQHTIITGQEIYHQLMANNSSKPLDIIKEGSFIGKSQTERADAADTGTTFYVYLDEYFSILNHAFPIFLLNDDLKLTVRWTSNEKRVIESDKQSIASFNIISSQLVCQYTKAAQSVVDYVKATKAKEGGFPIYAHKFNIVKHAIAPGSGTASSVFLGTLHQKDILTLMLALQDDTDVAAGRPTVFKPLGSWNLKSASKNIHGVEFDVDPDFFKKVQLNDYYPNGSDYFLKNNVYMISYSNHLGEEFSEINQQYSFSRYFAERDAQLNVTLPSNPVNGMTLNIMSTEVHLMIIDANGNIQDRLKY